MTGWWCIPLVRTSSCLVSWLLWLPTVAAALAPRLGSVRFYRALRCVVLCCAVLCCTRLAGIDATHFSLAGCSDETPTLNGSPRRGSFPLMRLSLPQKADCGKTQRGPTKATELLGSTTCVLGLEGKGKRWDGWNGRFNGDKVSLLSDRSGLAFVQQESLTWTTQKSIWSWVALDRKGD